MKFPSEWLSVRIKDVITDMQPGFAQRPGDAGTIPQIRTHNISPQGQIDLNGLKFVNPSTVELEHYSLQPGDVIFNNTNSEEWVGKTAVFKEKGNYVFSNHMTRIRVDTSLISKDFLAYYLHFLWKSGFSKQKAKRWVSQAGIDQSALQEFIVPLPTLIEQENIVSILRQADELCGIRNNFSNNCLSIKQQLFTDIFGDLRKTNEKLSLGNITSFITSGSRDWSRYYSQNKNDPKFIRVQDIKNGILDFSDCANVKPPETSEAKRARVKPNDIVISITGTIGQAAFATDKLGDAYVSQHVAIVRTNGNFPVRFLVDFLNHPLGGQIQLQRMNYGQTKPGLNLTQISEIKIPVFESNKINHYVKCSSELEKLVGRFNSSNNMYHELNKFLLADAFTGSLTASWRQNYRKDLEKSAVKRDSALGISKKKVSISVHAPDERPWLAHPNRHWLMDQLSDLQGFVYDALREWKGTLIPSEDLETFREQAFPVEHLEDANNQILRALHQLAGLGLIAKISLYNYEGDYVTAFRGLREEELSQVSDRQYLAKG